MTSAATQSAIASENATSSSSQDSPMDDPLFLHHAESPSTILITQPLIGRELLNMGSSCEESFTQQEQIGFIDGSLTLSSPLVSTPSVVQAWIRCDNMVGTWLTNSMSPKLQASIIYEDTTFEIWTNLRN